MTGSLISDSLSIGDSLLCLVGIGCILFRKQGVEYKALCLFLGLRAAFYAITLPFLVFAGHGIEAHLAYRLYFFTYWLGFGAESVVGLLLIYSIFNLAMAPLEGLQRLGTLVFRWAGSISFAIALGFAITPHSTQMTFIISFMTEFQRMQSILTLCLLLFVCFAIRPMGLTYSSRIFGVSLGLGILATTNLVASAWIAHFKSMYTVIDAAVGIASWGVLILWIMYFALPEPKRRLIVLPTTSPFLRWNQISQVLGADPGFVAIGGIPPDFFAPAELEVMRRASVKMSGQPETALQQHKIA
jgi:hypothetical protein